MNRRKAREMALQALFTLDFNDTDTPLEPIFAESGHIAKGAHDYALTLVQGTREHLAEIDAMLSDVSHDWALPRMNGVDRNILRMAVYEMHFSAEHLPAGIAINEAVELAKSFGTEKSSRFVNGVLDSLTGKRVE